MPTYKYRCAICEEEFEVVQSIHDDSKPPCQTCEYGAREPDKFVERLISRSSFALVGRGWSRDGYSK